jgi:hypothetical protein
MAGAIDDDERTNALGLFNTARSYWRSAEHLNAANLKVTHPQAPVTFLFCHAIELYLKAYLRDAGNGVTQLKKIGHRIAELAKSATETGLKIEPEQSEILSHIDDGDVAIEARYIVTGFKRQPTIDALSAVAETLDKNVGQILELKGLPIRAETFIRPAQKSSVELDPETISVLLYLFEVDSEQDRQISAMVNALDLQRSVVHHELDKLELNGLVEIADYNPVWGYDVWELTPEGRTYVVKNKLHKLGAT